MPGKGALRKAIPRRIHHGTCSAGFGGSDSVIPDIRGHVPIKDVALLPHRRVPRSVAGVTPAIRSLSILRSRVFDMKE